MNFAKSTRGAVSVFLVIILVPCIFISALFVDMGRVYLSQGMAYSAADLALNSVLTKYDAELNEYYGLVASCQNMDDFYDVSEKFFLRTLSSQPLEEDEIKLLSDVFESTVRSVIGAEEISDMLDVEKVDDIKVEAVTDANLANSALLKEQIVEFMKYRGPITMTTALMDIIKKPDGTYKAGVDAVLNSDTDKPIVDAKQDFHDSESEFLSEAYNTYSYLYNNYSKQPLENSTLTTKIDKLSEHLNTYRAIHSTMIGCFYNTDNVCVFHRPVVSITAYDSTYTVQGVCTRVYTPTPPPAAEGEEETETETPDPIYYITWSDLNTIKNDLSSKITAFETAKKDFYESVNGISYTGDSHDIQYWAKVDSIIYGRNGGTNHVNNVATKAAAMIKAYAKLTVALTCTPDGTDFPSDYVSQCNTLINKAKDLQSKYLKAGVSGSGDAYLTLVANIERISAAEIYNTDPSSKLVNGQNIDTLLTGVANDLQVIKTYCESYVNILEKVINGGEITRGGKTITLKSLDALGELARNYESSYDAYKDTVEGAPETDLQKEMTEDLEKYDAAEYDEVDEEAILEMKVRLANIQSQYQAVINAIDGMKYGGKSMLEIKNYTTFKTAADTKVDPTTIGTTKTSVQNAANTTWSSLILPNLSSGQKAVVFNEADSFNLFLKPEMDKVDVPDLYMFFYNAFGVPKDTEVDKQEEEMGKAEGEANKNNSATIGASMVNPDAKQIVSDISKDYTAQFGFGTGINALVELITDITSGSFNDIRDNAYICSYILEMFTHATFENEGLYDCYLNKYGETATNALTGGSYPEKYELVNTTDEKMWKSESTTDVFNKTLTNKMKNATNNAAYGCELEYILYGKSTNEANVKAACADIFKIRLLLNTISGFANFWTGGDATSRTFDVVAATVFSLSCGVIPAAAVKAVLIMVLVAYETCNDMSRLKCGFPVELYKFNTPEQRDWKCALTVELGHGSTISDALSSLVGENVVNTGEGFTYGDYVKLFVCISVWGDDEAETPEMSEVVMLRVADLIQTNMRHVTGVDTYKLSNSNTHFKLHGKLRVTPLIIDSPFFNEFNTSLTGATNWLEYEVDAVRGY